MNLFQGGISPSLSLSLSLGVIWRCTENGFRIQQITSILARLSSLSLSEASLLKNMTVEIHKAKIEVRRPLETQIASDK